MSTSNFNFFGNNSSTTSSNVSPIVDPSYAARELGDKYSLSSRNVVSSAYWKVPDPMVNLTAVACHETDPLVAIASGARDNNLFIYEVNSAQDDRHYPAQSNGYYNYPTNYGDDSDYYNHSTDDILGCYGEHQSHQEERQRRKVKSHLRTVSGTSFGSFSTASDFVSFSSGLSNNAYGSATNVMPSPILTHHQTISLGGIHSLAWVPSKHTSANYGNVLATGHNSGLVHMVLLPDPYTNNGPAEIISRFNHTRHVSKRGSHHASLGSTSMRHSTRIRSLNLTSSAWTCCPSSSIVSLYNEHVFIWDPSHSDMPLIVQRAKRTRELHASPLRNGIVSLATDRGISIMDLRYKSPIALAPPMDNTGLVSHVRWSSVDANRVASVHDETLIKIWDIRTGSPLVTLEGHYDNINSIEWSNTSADKFYSAAADGTVRLWDIKKCKASSDKTSKNSGTSGTKRGGMRHSMPTETAGSASIPSLSSLRRANTVGVMGYDSGMGLTHTSAYELVKRTEDWLPSQSWRLYRQRLARENSLPSYNFFLDNQNPDSPCTTVFNTNKQFLSLAVVQMPLHNGHNAKSVGQLVSIDSDGFFGVHTKINTKDDGNSRFDVNAGTLPATLTSHGLVVGKNKGEKRESIGSLDSDTSKSDLDERLDQDLNESPRSSRGSRRRSSSSSQRRRHSSYRRPSTFSGEQSQYSITAPVPPPTSAKRSNTISTAPAATCHEKSASSGNCDFPTSRHASAKINTDRFSMQIQPLNFLHKPNFNDEYMARKLENFVF
jgi:hypothetical protein